LLPRTLRVSNLQVSIIPSLSGFARRRPDALEKREIPETGSDEADVFGPTAVLNLYLPQAPTPDQADSLQYYRGEREPDPEDPTLAETGPDTLAFSGEINGLATEITLLDYQGLTTEPDTIPARIAYTISGVQTTQDLTLTETGPETCIFRTVFTDPTPETLEANIYLPVSPTDEVADSLQYYYGEREPLPDDPILIESDDDPSSLIFTGTFASTSTTITIDPTTFNGLTENLDSFRAVVSHSLQGVGLMSLSALFAETGPDGCVFRSPLYEHASPDDARVGAMMRFVAATELADVTSEGAYRPSCLRVLGMPHGLAQRQLGRYRFTVYGVRLGLEEVEHAYYLKGGSLWITIVTIDPETGDKVGCLWDDSNNNWRVEGYNRKLCIA